jgi:uncharacterized repeat protein (TIGR03843 family)
VPTGTDAEVVDLLASGDLTPVGRIVDSSNGALLCSVAPAGGGDAEPLLVIHKPEASERPLWDYPDGPVEGVPDPLVDVTPADAVPDGWVVVLEGESRGGAPVVVSHSPEPALRTVAVLDAVLNNSDRKGSHLLRDGDLVRGCDHGVSLGVEPKLRTVLWGWAGDPLPEADLARLERLLDALRDGLPDQLEPLLTRAEVRALRARTESLLRTARHPLPQPGWPAIPWPAL